MDCDYAERIEQLEDIELELKATTADFYTELLGLYMCRNELIEARNLVQRIPIKFRLDNDELSHIELLLNSLLGNNFADFFQNIEYKWSETMKDIMENLKTKTMENVFKLVALAYTSISEKTLLHMTQLSPDELKSICQKLGWSYENGNEALIILPTQSIDSSSSFANSKHQMFKLTEFVTFLEN